MSPIKHHCILVHSEVIEAVWVLAQSPEQAKQLAQTRHGRQEIDRHIKEMAVCASEEVFS